MIAVLTPLSLAFRTPMDAAQWRVYFQALEDVPLRLLQEAVGAFVKQDRAFMPKPGELRTAAEQARLKLLAAVPYTGCDECSGTGWRSLTVNRVPIAERCPCKQAHLAQLAEMGLGPALVQPQLEAGEFDAKLAQTGDR